MNREDLIEKVADSLKEALSPELMDRYILGRIKQLGKFKNFDFDGSGVLPRKMREGARQKLMTDRKDALKAMKVMTSAIKKDPNKVIESFRPT